MHHLTALLLSLTAVIVPILLYKPGLEYLIALNTIFWYGLYLYETTTEFTSFSYHDYDYD